MGKATIVAHLGGARYSVVIEQDESRIDDMIQSANDMLELLAPELDAAQADYDQAIADYLAALAERDDDINLAIPGVPIPEQLARSINEKTSEISEWFDTVAKAEFRLNNIKARIASLEKRIEWLQSLYGIDPLPTAAYCIDLSDGDPVDGRPLLSGDVATITPYRRGDEVFLMCGNTPTFRADPSYVPVDDGVIVPVAAMTPAQYLYNYAMWPGAEVWLQYFHVGFVTSKNIGTGTLDVDMQYFGDLRNHNFAQSYSQLSVEYMGCGYKAFLAGDRVMVAKDPGWAEPKVVGFAEAPRACPVDLDFLVHATTEGTYWRCTYTDGSGWTKVASSRIAGPSAWIGKAGQCVTCSLNDKKAYYQGSSYNLPVLVYNGQSSIDPATPLKAGINASGKICCIAGWHKFSHQGGATIFFAQISMFEWTGSSFVRKFDILSLGSSQYSTVRAWLDALYDEAFEMNNDCSKAAFKRELNARYVEEWDFDWTSMSATKTKTTRIGSGSMPPNAVEMTHYSKYRDQFDTTDIYEADFSASHSYTSQKVFALDYDSNRDGFKFHYTDVGGNIAWIGTTRGQYGGSPPEYVSNKTNHFSGVMNEVANIWGTSLSCQSLANLNGTWSVVNGTFSTQSWVLHHCFLPSRCAVAVFRPQVVGQSQGAWDNPGFATGGNSGEVQGMQLIINGAVVDSIGDFSSVVTNTQTSCSELFTETINVDNWPEVVIDIEAKSGAQSPAADTGTSAAMPSPRSYSPGQFMAYQDGYMDVAADMAGNAMAITQQTVAGQRIMYITDGDFNTLFSGFDVDGLRLVGMI